MHNNCINKLLHLKEVKIKDLPFQEKADEFSLNIKTALHPVIEHDSKNHTPTLNIEPFNLAIQKRLKLSFKP